MAFGDITNLTTAADATGTTEVLTIPAGGVPAGSLLIVAGATRSASVDASCADDAANSYTRVRQLSGSGATQTNVFYVLSCAALAQNDTITVSGLVDANARAFTAFYVEGPFDALNDSASATNTGTALDTGSVTTTVDDAMILGFAGLARPSSDSITQDADYSSTITNAGTNIAGDGTDRRIFCGSRLVTATETNNYALTITNSIWTGVILAFSKAAAGAITGTLAATLDSVTAAFTGTVVNPSGITGTMAATLDGITAAATGQTGFITDDFEESSVIAASSTVTGIGDSSVWSAQTRKIANEAFAAGAAKWLKATLTLVGVAGLRPIIELKQYTDWHGGTWPSTRRIYFSEDDGATWAPFVGAPTVGASTVRYQHNAAFTANRVIIAYSPPETVSGTEDWIDALVAAHANKIKNALSNTSAFRSAMFTAQTTELGDAVPSQPLLAFDVADDDLPSPSGARGIGVITAGVHSGEDRGDALYKAIIAAWCAGTTEADYLRTHIHLKTKPCLHPMGRRGGHHRGSWEPGLETLDMNRHASETDSGMEAIDFWHDAEAVDLADRPAVVFELDCHEDFGFGGHTDPLGLFIGTSTINGLFRDAIEARLGAGTVNDFGNSTSDTVAKWYRDNKGAKLGLTVELATQSPRSDANLATYATAIVGALYDMIQADTLHFNVGTAAATLDGITASFSGTASAAPGGAGITGTLAATFDEITASFTGTVDNPITGTFAATLDDITASFTGSATGDIIYSAGQVSGGMLVSVGKLMGR